jgi:hypothetical protein
MRSSLSYPTPFPLQVADHQNRNIIVFQDDLRGICATLFFFFSVSVQVMNIFLVFFFQVLLRRVKSVERDTDKLSSGIAALQANLALPIAKRG